MPGRSRTGSRPFENGDVLGAVRHARVPLRADWRRRSGDAADRVRLRAVRPGHHENPGQRAVLRSLQCTRRTAESAGFRAVSRRVSGTARATTRRVTDAAARDARSRALDERRSRGTGAGSPTPGSSTAIVHTPSRTGRSARVRRERRRPTISGHARRARRARRRARHPELGADRRRARRAAGPARRRRRHDRHARCARPAPASTRSTRSAIDPAGSAPAVVSSVWPGGRLRDERGRASRRAR